MNTRRLSSRMLGPLLILVIGGCGTTFDPRPIEEVPFRERAITQQAGGIRVTAAVPSAKESRKLFSSKLYRQGVQPVWIQVENTLTTEVSFLPLGVDPEYYTPIATAYLTEAARNEEAAGSVARYFLDRGMPFVIGPGEVRAGFVFTPLDEGTKTFNVDIMESSGGRRFTFFVPVPGLELDHYRIDWDERLASPDTTEIYEVSRIIEALETMPCCTTNKGGEDQGDPLNIVVIGHPDDLYYAFVRAGWDETETLHRASLWKTAASFLTGGEYRYSPVSSLYVFGRPQDVAFQKSRESINERNHLRLWMSDLRWQGQPVWIGQISRDIGVRFTTRTITTHKIDPNVDETREFLLEDLAYSQSVAETGYVTGVGEASIDAPRGNLTGDPYFTDGHRLVVWVSSQPNAIADIKDLDWRPAPED